MSVDERRLISLSSNDYLGLTHHPRLRSAHSRRSSGSVRGSAPSGRSPGRWSSTRSSRRSPRPVQGGRRHAGVGFTANTGVLPTVTGEQDLIVSDALNHASIIDGMRLSTARSTRTPRPCARSRRGARPSIALPARPRDRLSMDSDIAPLPGIVEAAEAFGAAVMVDDAHASGGIGRNGRGERRPLRLHGRVAIQVGTLSKAMRLAAMSQHPHPAARPSCSTSHPPAVAAACLEAIQAVPGGGPLRRPALGEHASVQGRPVAARVRHQRVRDPDHAGHDGGGPVQRPAVRGGLHPADRLLDGRGSTRPGSGHRHGRPQRRQPSTWHSRRSIGSATRWA